MGVNAHCDRHQVPTIAAGLIEAASGYKTL